MISERSGKLSQGGQISPVPALSRDSMLRLPCKLLRTHAGTWSESHRWGMRMALTMFTTPLGCHGNHVTNYSHREDRAIKHLQVSAVKVTGARWDDRSLWKQTVWCFLILLPSGMFGHLRAGRGTCGRNYWFISARSHPASRMNTPVFKTPVD